MALAVVMASAVVGVVGGSGGSGASTFAAALAAGAGGPSVLIDLDPVGVGIDVLLGIESVAGARWSGLQLGGGHLDPDLFHQGLPRWGDVAVLADPAESPPGDAVEAVLEAARAIGPVVIDAGRVEAAGRSIALSQCDLVILVAAGNVAGLAAALRAREALPVVSVGAVLRRGSVRAADAAELLGVPVLATLPDVLRQDTAVPQSWIRLGRGIVDGLSVGVG
jgi:MinD superfamily P-loop ATPase